MKIGTIGYATSRGLGHLCRDFYRHGVITDVMVVRHPGVPTNEGWYPGTPETAMRPFDHEKMREFCRGKDAMLFFETPFDWGLFDWCKQIGVKTFLIPMHECFPSSAPKPYKFLNPSLLDVDYFGGPFLPLPVEYPWRERTHAEHYVHNGGYLGMRGREGTTLLIEAMQYVRSPLKLTIRVQENVPKGHQAMMARDPRIEYIAATVPYEDLYGVGDVVVAPQKFNGCSLPLQEALASGMLVMSTDRYPMNTWLPREPLIPTRGSQKARIGGAYLEFDEAIIDPQDIAATMDAWYGKPLEEFSQRGKAWAKENSWERLKPKWLEALAS